MNKYSQAGITIGTLGAVITLIGLFPGISGLEATEGIGVLQVLMILLGFSLLFLGAYIVAKVTFYRGLSRSLAQDIGIRLTLTGILFSAAAGLADVLGFGSHPPTKDARPLLGNLQAIAFIGGFLIASLGVIVFALFGPPPDAQADSDKKNNSSPADKTD